MAKYVLDFLNIFTGLRKSIVMLLLMIIGTYLILRGFLNGGQFVDLFKAVVISYFGANGVEHFSSMIQAHLESKNSPNNAEKIDVIKNNASVIVGEGNE
jgi:hypothetical protein